MAKSTPTAEVEVDPVIAYILVRFDAPEFNIGKALAQVHHCGTQMTEELRAKNYPELNEIYQEWQEDRTFGTVLTLAVSAAEMRQAVSLAQLLGLHAGITHDPTYPVRIQDGDRATYITMPIDSCAYIFGKKSECVPVVGLFPLMNERYIPR